MRNIFDTLFFTEIISGMSLTLKHMFKKKVTVRYPYAKAEVFPRARGVQYMNFDENGVTKCVGCYLCQKVCPSECITIKTDCGPNGERLIKSYHLDLSRCIYCGYCEEACPVDAIRMGCNFHTVADSRDGYVINMKTLVGNTKTDATTGNYVIVSDQSEKGE